MSDGNANAPESAPRSIKKREGKTSSPASPARAQEAFKAGASGQIDRKQAQQIVGLTRRGLQAAIPEVTSALVDKALRGKGSPVDVKAAMFLLSAAGVSLQGSPVSEEERKKIEEELDELNGLDVVELSRRLHEEAGVAPVPPLASKGEK